MKLHVAYQIITDRLNKTIEREYKNGTLQIKVGMSRSESRDEISEGDRIFVAVQNDSQCRKPIEYLLNHLQDIMIVGPLFDVVDLEFHYKNEDTKLKCVETIFFWVVRNAVPEHLGLPREICEGYQQRQYPWSDSVRLRGARRDRRTSCDGPYRPIVTWYGR